MSFIVSATTAARDVSYRRGSMLSALEQGLTMLSSGMQDVRITDIQGRRSTVAEFSRKVFETRDETPHTGRRAAPQTARN